MLSGTGYYVATLDARGRRVRRHGLLARGNGEWEIENGTLRFRRYLTKQSIVIEASHVLRVERGGSWFGGKWIPRASVALVHWAHNSSEYVSGFVFGRNKAEYEAAMAALGRPRG